MVKVTIEIDGEVTDVLTGDHAWGAVAIKKGGMGANVFIKGKTSRAFVILGMISTIPHLIQMAAKDDPEVTDRALALLASNIEVARAEIKKK